MSGSIDPLPLCLYLRSLLAPAGTRTWGPRARFLSLMGEGAGPAPPPDVTWKPPPQRRLMGACSQPFPVTNVSSWLCPRSRHLRAARTLAKQTPNLNAVASLPCTIRTPIPLFLPHRWV
eukprot:GGOE01005219.1.p3 GENE.GGOE01005219.1~~GGOE01005219.1.p3  ORF type:complete len:119 (+),score=1.64 GGOE01005219.1:220-576(+)